jgi:antitoxin component YwqK of YwqJK toxin-antitoxin module
MKGKKVTVFKKHSEDGILLIEGKYDDLERKTGVWCEYYKTGKIAAKYRYRNGMLNGMFISYHENGALWNTVNYVNDKKEGIFKIYNPDGEMISSCEYHNDKIVNQGYYMNV